MLSYNEVCSIVGPNVTGSPLRPQKQITLSFRQVNNACSKGRTGEFGPSAGLFFPGRVSTVLASGDPSSSRESSQLLHKGRLFGTSPTSTSEVTSHSSLARYLSKTSFKASFMDLTSHS